MSQTDNFSTPFQPRDYNKFTYKFEFSKDLMADEEGEQSTQESQMSQQEVVQNGIADIEE